MRLDPDKSPLLLLRATAIVKERFGVGGFELVVAGAGSLAADLS